MRILIIEDDLELCTLVSGQLTKAGYETDCCHTGGDALFYAASHSYDAIVLDRMLPELDGLTLLLALRRKGVHTPVIMATAMDGLGDRIDGLDAGADDYIVKPYAVTELMARIRAVTRRPGWLEDERRLTFAGLSLDEDTLEVKSAAKSLTLSKKEAALLAYFIKNGGRTLTRPQILAHIWGPDYEVEEGNLDNYIYFLRKRLKSLGGQAAIKTVHAVGYRLEETYD